MTRASTISIPALADESLDRAVAQIVTRLEAGEEVDIADLAAGDDERLDQLQKLLPTLAAMVDLGHALLPDSSNSRVPPGRRTPHSALNGTLGDFQILREIGRGGMGIVYEAEQLSLGRKVALKVLPLAGLLDKRALTRFQNEARAAATLFHPNIVPVHYVGAERGVHFYAMQLIEGQSLAEIIAALRESRAGERSVVSSQSSVAATDHGQPTTDRSQSEISNPKSEIDTAAIAALSTEYTHNPKRYFRRVAEIGIQIAQGLHHAHESGILHRDVKPANILLDGEGKPWITDFGLARIETDSRVTAAGDILGTLRYMAPEQTESQGVVDARADVYSLGATLYEALTLAPVFADSDRATLLRHIAAEDPTPLRRVRPEVPADLETIVHKTLAKDPHDRYATAAELSADLRRFLDSQPIRARRASPLARVQMWGRRHIAAVMGVCTLLVVSLTVLGVSFALITSEQRAKIAALEEAQTNLQVATEAVNKLYLNFAVEWLAKESAPSNLQQEFLLQAAEFYDRIAKRPAETPQDRLMQATAYERFGEVHKYLEFYESAVDPLEKSVELGRRLRSEFPSDAAYHEAMTDRLMKLGHVHRELLDFDKSEAAFREAIELSQSLVDNRTNADRQVAGKLELADVMQRQGKLDEALHLAEDIRDDLVRQTRPGHYFPLALIRCRFQVASVLLEEDRLAEAKDENEKGLSQCQLMRAWFHQDDRSLHKDHVNLTVQAGDISARQGELDEAIGQYEAALELQRQSLKERLSPQDFNIAKFEGRVTSDPEPGLFCRYMETQLRLADVLRRAGRPYDAQAHLGSCEYPTRVLTEYAAMGVLRYRALQANVWAMAAELALAQGHPAEALQHHRIAARVWADALAWWPRAAEFKSGVHGLKSDLAWFRERMPGELAEIAATPDETKDLTDTPFGRRANAATAYRGEAWQVAVKGFTRAAQLSAELGQIDHAYDWLHIAMAHAHLGHSAEAKEHLDTAAAEIAAMDNPPLDLLRIRDEAQKLLELQ